MPKSELPVFRSSDARQPGDSVEEVPLRLGFPREYAAVKYASKIIAVGGSSVPIK
jgi:hypothetical protein